MSIKEKIGYSLVILPYILFLILVFVKVLGSEI